MEKRTGRDGEDHRAGEDKRKKHEREINNIVDLLPKANSGYPMPRVKTPKKGEEEMCTTNEDN